MSVLHSLPPVSDHFYVLPSNTEQLNVETLVGSLIYTANITKRIIIPSGIIVGSASTATAALTIPSGGQGRIIIENYGEIQGAGGPAGGNGGDAILAQSLTQVINRSTGKIYAGGGGGGTGGVGGTGGPGTYQAVCCFTSGVRVTNSSCSGSCPGGYFCYSGCGTAAANGFRCATCATYQTYYTTGGAGGAGGEGGVGIGYNQSLSLRVVGSAGSPGGTNAGAGGTGGTGGAGGTWGASGNTGDTGSAGANGNAGAGAPGNPGTAGGLAGYYINGLSTYVTLTNSGLVAGRSN